MIHLDKYIEQAELEIYPMTIVCDRYTGAYSGGVFTAWNLDFFDVPKEIEGDDSECDNFWFTYTGLVGKGRTPDEALEDLCKEMYKLKNK